MEPAPIAVSAAVLLGLCCLTVRAAQNGLVGISFTKEPQSLVVVPGDEVAFTCGVNLNADHLTWLHDWKPLEPGSDPNIDVSPGRLLIRVGSQPDVYNRQTGEYRCMAQIAPIGLTSLPATLSIAHILPFESRPNSTLVAPPGGIVSIPCPPPTSDPPAIVQFFRDGQPVTNRGDSITVLPGGRLHLSDVSVAQAGTYSCAATNHLTGETVTAPFVTRLEVRQPPRTSAPRLVVPPEPIYSVKAGTTLRIECVAEGWPRPIVGWKRMDARRTDDSRFVQHAASLEIRNVRRSDQGSYLCEVANQKGTITAGTVVRVIEPPSVETSQQNLTVAEGAPAELVCSGRGQPPPRLQWVLNGRPVLGGRRPTVDRGRLQFEAVTRQDAGLYQCFGHSEAGDDKAAVLLKVIPRQSMSSGSAVMTSTPAPTERQTPGRRRGNGNRNRDGELMVPPSAPSVYPISESSVMLKWDVPENDGLSILFFKIQYRRAPRRRHDWQTHDADVPGTARSFEVDGLEVGAKYKFRVLAVYENKDNKHGPNSRKVKMTRMRKKAKPPGAPVIVSHSPRSPNAIQFSWKYSLQAAPIEGYFIFFRDTTMAGEYSKVTVLGEATKEHTLTPLLPSTTYDIKLQAFNLEGGVSAFSQIITERTEDSPDAPTTESPGGGHTVPIVTTRGVGRSRVRLYAIVGGVLGLLLLLALLFALIYYCRSRAGAKHDEAKFGDTSQTMHLQQQQPFTVSDRELSVAPLRRQASYTGSDAELAVTPLQQPEQPATPPPPPLPFKQRSSAISETSFGAVPVAIPVPPCCDPVGAEGPASGGGPSDSSASGAASGAVLNNNKYTGGGDTVERRRRILRRKDSIEAQRHRLSGR
ncbi:interference hedgehog-like [Amphibalanus amphitrite]|uniref:interference hedgehog-like n=1 Tax=Amphibalanus amphitrite TaxID=1232801 RepID=UPI001C902671|nr:interference hedgehog-like [Amphibalanus amphitrite]XP_043190654.1 interference hedgehog-like [Amphibalanus amphitrite]